MKNPRRDVWHAGGRGFPIGTTPYPLRGTDQFTRRALLASIENPRRRMRNDAGGYYEVRMGVASDRNHGRKPAAEWLRGGFDLFSSTR